MVRRMKKGLLLTLMVIALFAASITSGYAAEDLTQPSAEAEADTEVVSNVEEGAFVGTIPEEGLQSSEGQVTLTVDGVETQIVPGTEYAEADNAYVTITTAAGDYASETATGAADYRTGLFVSTDGVDDEKSVLEAVVGGSYDGTSATGLTIDSNSDNFGALILLDAGEYTLSDSEFNFLSNADGSNTNDFIGYGAVINAFGDSKLVIDNVYINTEGVARPAVVADEGADVLVQNSTISVAGGTLYEGYQNTADTTVMVAPPWVLGIGGNARATNLLGNYSTTTFVNSDISANGWGVLSTDGCSNVVLMTVDSKVTISGDTGYGTYAIGDAKEYFYGTTFDVATFANIITGGYVTYASSNGSFSVQKDDDAQTTVFEDIEGAGNVSTVNSDAFGIMWHGNGIANVIEGSVFNTQNAIFLVKNGTVVINVDDAELNAADGVILQMMDNDDSVVGMGDPSTMTFNTEYNEEEGYPGIDNDVKYDASAADSMGGMTGMPEGEAAEGEGMPEGEAAEGEGMPEGEAPAEGEEMPEGEAPAEGEEMPEGEAPAEGEEMPEGEAAEGEGMPEGEAAEGEGMPEGEAMMMESEPLEGAATNAEGEEYTVTANFENVTLEGDMYNGTGYLGAPKTLLVTLGSGAELTGAISATSVIHSTDGGETQNASFTIDEYYMLNHVANKVYYNGDNDVDVVVADGGVWNVTEESYLTSLTVENGGTLNGSVTVDGASVKLENGTTYSGTIVVTPGSQSNVIAIVLIIVAVLVVAAVLFFVLKKKGASKNKVATETE